MLKRNAILVAVLAASLFALTACEGPWGRAFVQGQWFDKGCAAGGGHYDASGRGSCPDFSPRELFR